MTEADYIATAPRSGKAFTFTRIRGNATQAFLPGEGTRLKFVSRATDTLEIVDLPAGIDANTGLPTGFLASGDTVTVAYKGPEDSAWVTVFRGEVDHISYDFTRGDTATQTAVVAGPWAKMARLVFKQPWAAQSGYQDSSRLILNQAEDGTAQNVNVALRQIAWGANNGAPAACGYTLTQESEEANINVSSTITLPFDECRDITIADAIRRELRLFPAAVTFFDYSTNPPTLKIQMPATSGSDASYVADVPKTVRQYTLNPHPVDAVDLEIETVGSGYRVIDHQRAAKTGATYANNPNCLYATLQLAGAESAAVTQSLTVTTETRPELTSKTWWKSKHPRLANVALEAFAISEQGYSGSGYAYIADCSADELKAYGKNAEVETFHCLCKITTTDDVEEQIYLSMEFVTTDFNANNTRTITRTVESSYTSGETVPSNLAQQILDARSGELRAERFTMRLGAAADWPKIGDLCDGLILQSFTVDCTNLLADLDFGAPEYLSPEDMAGLLTNFRNKRRATLSSSRVSGKPDSGVEADVEDTGIKPLSSTEWAPGIKSKTTIKAATQTRSGGSGKIVLDSGAVENGGTMQVKKLTLKGATEEEDQEFQILATEDVEIDPGEGGVTSVNEEDGALTVNGGTNIKVTSAGKTITISYMEGKEPDEDAVEEDSADCNEWTGEGFGMGGGMGDHNGWSMGGGGGPSGSDANLWGEDDCGELNGW